MKRVFLLFMLLVTAFSLVACDTVSMSYSYIFPWDRSSNYEEANYAVTRYYHLKEDHSENTALKGNANYVEEENPEDDSETEEKIIIATGVYSYSIQQTETAGEFLFQQTLEITYVDNNLYTESLLGEKEYDRLTNYMTDEEGTAFSKTDTMTSSLLFSMKAGTNYRPISLTKSYDIQSQDITLNLTGDYKSHKLTYSLNDAAQKTKTYKAKELSGTFDNDLLFVRLRAIDSYGSTTWKEGSSLVLSGINNWTDAVMNDEELSIVPLRASITEEKALAPAAALKEQLFSSEAADFTIPSYAVALTNYEDSTKGNPIYAYFSKEPFTVNSKTLARVMIKNIQEEYDVTERIKTFSTVYDLEEILPFSSV